MIKERAARLRQARQKAGWASAVAAADHFRWNRNTYASNENGNAPYSYRRAKEYGAAFGVDPQWLYDGVDAEDGSSAGPPPAMARVIGLVGANPAGVVLYATGQEGWDLAPIPPGGSAKAAALRVVGHSMHPLADDGALIYFEDQRSRPSRDMLGEVVVVETETDEVLVKRLLRGTLPEHYGLESLSGPTRRDVRLRWAARITAIIPPHQARKIIRSSVEGDA